MFSRGGKRFSATHVLQETPHVQRTAEQKRRNKQHVSVYNQPDCRKPLRKDGERQALTQQARCSERIHGGKAGASAEKDTGLVKQKPTPCPQAEEEPHGSPLRTVPQWRHSWRIWQPTLALALLPPSSVQPPPVAILLHDERLSNPTTTHLLWLVLNGLHAARGIGRHLCPRGPAGEGDMSPSPFFSLPSRQHL